MLISGASDIISPIGHEDLGLYYFLYESGVMITIAHCVIFAQICFLYNFGRGWFFNQVELLIKQLKKVYLSPTLVHQTLQYFETLWNVLRGEITPELVTMAPLHLQQPILIAFFAKHIEQHFLFADTHIDFLRQLYLHVQRWFLISSQTIVYQGDVDYSMYFITSGMVQGAQLDGDREIKFLLRKGESFGELNGLFGGPHRATYTCLTSVELLVLQRDKWEYLLEWFPASKAQILEMAERFRTVATLQLLHVLKSD
ncbi:potassium voltage-gated channel subfamily H member 8-like [Atheta coriaria]|uniref:potassium voltage-gated channel subfamily H member 8-like n=1 Tax=Dalotia coriaria TaxID=877792 RepID=UPI0031F41724